MSQALLQQAREHHRAGRIDAALQAYGELTRSAPGVAEHWRLRAIVEHQAGRLAEARSSIARALALDEADAATQLVAGHVAEDLRDPDGAEARYRRAVALKPAWAAAWNSLGTLLLDRGRAEEAVTCFQRSVDAAPSAARSWNNLGLAQLALERLDDATRAFNQATLADPRYGLPHFNLARIFELRGNVERGIASARRAVALDPRLVEAHLFLGDLQRRLRDMAGAQESYATAVALTPREAKARNALADLYWEIGMVAEARATFAAVEGDHPGNFKAAVGRRLLLPAVYDGAEHLRASRRAYESGLAELVEGANRFHWDRPADALSDVKWTNFYLAYQGGNDRELQAAYGEFVQRVLQPVVPKWLERRAPRARGAKRIRVGFFSFFFFNCTAGRYFASWIHGLDPKRFEKVVYYINPWMAEDSRAIAASADRFRHLPGRSLHVLAQHVLADELDVLVYPELGMNADTFGLASLRLAPVQVAGWGHPTTTGLPSIDWFLSSREMEPEGAQALYTERLATLPGLGTRYAAPAGEEQGTRADFGLPDERNLYLIPQSIFKIHPDNDALIAQVLARDPRGKAVMFAANHRGLTDRFVARLDPLLRERGMSVAERIIFLPYMTHGAYLRLNRLCDVMLDTLHWSGGNTSLDALACGLPVVTLPGAFMRGRQSMAMLRLIGVPELVAAGPGEYVDLAVRLGGDAAERGALSARIASGVGGLFDRDEPVRALERFLEQAVEEGAPGAGRL